MTGPKLANNISELIGAAAGRIGQGCRRCRRCRQPLAGTCRPRRRDSWPALQERSSPDLLPTIVLSKLAVGTNAACSRALQAAHGTRRCPSAAVLQHARRHSGVPARTHPPDLPAHLPLLLC